MIFISYQRSDDSVVPKLVRDALTSRIRRRAAAFLDIDSIPPGFDFVEVIRDALDRCSTLLAMIGPHWDPKRLWNPADYVRLELLTARELGKPIVPVPHSGANLPTADELPAELRFLVGLNTFCLGDSSRLDDDIKRLANDARAWVPKVPLWQIAQGDFARATSLDFREPWKLPWRFSDVPLQTTS